MVPCAIGASSPGVSGAVLLVYSVSRFAVVRFNGATHQDGVFGLLFAAPIVPADRGPDALPLWHVPDLNDLLLHVFLLHEWNPDAWHRIDGSYWTLPVQAAAFAVAALLWRSKLHRRVRATVVLWAAMAVSAVSPLIREFAGTLPDATGMNRAYLFAAGVAIWLWQGRRLPTNQLVPLLCVTLLLQYLRTLPLWGRSCSASRSCSARCARRRVGRIGTCPCCGCSGVRSRGWRVSATACTWCTNSSATSWRGR